MADPSAELHIPKLQSKTLRRATDLAAYHLYRAALEWDLVEPILIRDRKDLKSEPQWREHLEPYHHQVENLVTFCRRLPVTLLADDVGLGKTISAGLIASELMCRKRISKILIVCPKLLIPQWKEELASKFGIPAVEATGKELVAAKVPDDGGAVITTYQSARMYLDALQQAGFEMLILDEAHKLRNLYGVDQSPQVAQRFREALADRRFKYVLMLTATPIQNRLWDIYSLVDLLAVARGHQNPFGSEGIFARTFIADDRTSARQLNANMREAFRSVVYGYMSRIRRADARLHFPERIVQLHKVDPLPEELELINLVGSQIQNLNRLAQISILQALISSPHAVNSQLKRMAVNKTVPESLSRGVDAIVARISTTAKLQGLAPLVERLRSEQPERWRMVVFTTRRETQTTIEAFLQQRGISCGLINGESGDRNQRTIVRFKKPIPEIHVIVSTEAGSEGVNLQAANVLVNFDLPWNPMIVEQRIGRIQRLASEHASVCIFNIVLRGTFEEYIIGRLIEKLQMASHAIGDIEALLEASGLNGHGDDDTAFEEKVRQLVIASLAGKDVEAATRLTEKSILDAKQELQTQEKNIDAMLGGMDQAARDEIRYPDFPPSAKSMGAREFVLAALHSEGGDLRQESANIYVCERDGRLDRICFEDAYTECAVLYRPGSPAFTRLASGIAARGQHRVEDHDDRANIHAQALAREWVQGFGASFIAADVQDVARSFTGSAMVRVRAAVSHDSYERLIELPASPEDGWVTAGIAGASPLSDPLKNPEAVGIKAAAMVEKAIRDDGVAEFCRFYLDRRKYEVESAGDDARKKKKMQDDFTPRLEVFLVGLEGNVRRRVTVKAKFSFDTGPQYQSEIAVIPAESKMAAAPEIGRCDCTSRPAPVDCLGHCAISGLTVLRHLLKGSELSGRTALAEFIVTCSETGKAALKDELEPSAVTGRLVSSSALKTSAVSGKRAEARYFGKCEFSGAEALETELATSQVSGRKYRKDRHQRSVVSGKTGHTEEFVVCPETQQPLIVEEAERCEVTGKLVAPGLLSSCDVSGKRVLHTELEKSPISGKKALKELFVTSNISGVRFLRGEGTISAAGKHCLEQEAKVCIWSGKRCHPEDLRTCQLTRVTAHFEFMTNNGGIYLEPLVNLLNGLSRTTDQASLWPGIVGKVSSLFDGRLQIQAALSSPTGRHLAVCLEAKNWFGLKTRHVGMLYAVGAGLAVGRIVLGKRQVEGWEFEKAL
jgi:superfamily II DNA or RNA helicase